MKTKVIFRKFHGEVLALFPAIAGTVGNPWTCSSYAHMGQHSAATVDLVHCSRLATPAEYKPLARELRCIGYKLDIRKRITRADCAERCNQLKRP